MSSNSEKKANEKRRGRYQQYLSRIGEDASETKPLPQKMAHLEPEDYLKRRLDAIMDTHLLGTPFPKEFEKEPLMQRYKALKEKASVRNFKKMASISRKRVTASDSQIAAARQKLKKLQSEDNVFLRVDNLARALTELGSTDAFTGAEAVQYNVRGGLKNGVYEARKEHTPEETAYSFTKYFSHDVSGWERAKYNCAILFRKDAFAGGRTTRGNYRWGSIRDTRENPILAIQVFDPDPKVLLQVTKTVLKRASKSPVAIIDLYGKPFFP